MKNNGLLPLFGGVAAALAASSCCILPLLLGVASVGSVGVGAALSPYRPYFIALTALLLGGAFYFTYRPQKATGETECCDTKSVSSRRWQRRLLWGMTVFTVGMLAYPDFVAYGARSAANSAPTVVAGRAASTASFTIGNMTCEECTLPIGEALKATPGVYDAAVDFAAKRAIVRYDASKVSERELRTVIEKAGFPVVGAQDTAGGKKLEDKNKEGAITVLSDEAPLKKAFNGQSDKTRLILLLSPT